MPRMNPRLLLLVLCLAGNVLLAVALVRHGAPSGAATESDADPVKKLFHSQNKNSAAATATSAAESAWQQQD